MKDNKNICCETSPKEITAEERLRLLSSRIEELINDRNEILDKFTREERKCKVLIDCLSEENSDKKKWFEQSEFYRQRLESYRNAICDIAESCKKILEIENKNIPKAVKQAVKEIQEITNRF